MKKTINELMVRQREINDRLGDIEKILQTRELTEGEDTERKTLEREFDANKRELSIIKSEQDINKVTLENRDPQKALRELLVSGRSNKQTRQITLEKHITESGAIQLNIHDLFPTLQEGLGLPPSLKMLEGVTGNELYPYGIDDVEIEEPGEVEELNAQELNFDNVTANPKRAGLNVLVSNTAIDNAAFDLLGYVQLKFQVALKRYLAAKIYSQVAWTGIKGPFSGLTATGNIALDETAYKSILEAVASFTTVGFDQTKVCLIMDAVTEAALKATPRAAGQGGFVIQDGKCAGYDYVVSHYIDMTESGQTEFTTRYLGIGYFDYLALQQHGDVRLTVDGVSNGMAVKNCTGITLNTAFSITDLSVKLNGGSDKTQAFALYTVGA